MKQATTHDRVREIFLEALERESPEGREAFVREACGKDAEVLGKVWNLLKQEERAGDFFRPFEPSGDDCRLTQRIPAVPALEEGPGTRIGRYKLLEQIGEGGFGVVYMAEQVEPVFRRVALKIIKLGMDTREVIARFDAERQALALMDHPNVARVLDAGATVSGRPYFVMELVRGLPITDYCDRHRLSARDRIGLFIAVCQAAQHAHAKGIIHRDLKPSNVLVTTQDSKPVPKVIDFGIAKAIQQPLTQKTLFTRFGHQIGTPIYMSPEHLIGEDVDTRSDVYSLGVILYELLTGKQPFDLEKLRKAGQMEMLRIIEQEDPPPPSTRLTRLGGEGAQIAELRQTTAHRLSELIRGDLDWITMKALQKERSRRYDTPIALAEDLQRHLDHQPVMAGPPGVSYRAYKFVKRHRLGVAAMTGTFLAILTGLILAGVGFVKARDAADRALKAEAAAIAKGETALAEARNARANELRARQISYASDMGLASQALELGNLGRVQTLLRRHANSGPKDLRGWEWRYLWQECRSGELFQLGNLSNSVISLAVSADGSLVAAASLTGNFGVWDLTSRNQLAAGVASNSMLALSPDGQTLFGGDGEIRDAESGRAVSRANVRAIKKAVFSNDGSRLAALDGERLWVFSTADWSTKLEATGFPCLSMHVGGLALTSSGDVVAVGTEDGRVRLVDGNTGKEKISWQAHLDKVTALALSPDGTLLASGAGYLEDRIRVWRTLDGSLVKDLTGHRAWISSLAFSPDGATLASGSADQTIGVWDVETFELIARLKGHLHEVWAVAFVAGGKNLLSAGKDGSVKVWRVPSPSRVGPGTAFSLREDPNSRPAPKDILFSPDGAEVFGLDHEWHVGRWSVPGLRFLARVESLGSETELLAPHPSRQLLAAVDRSQTLRVMDFRTLGLVTNFPIREAKGRITRIQFATKANELVAIENFRQVHVYSTTDWECVGRWSVASNVNLTPVCLSMDGVYLARGGRDAVIHDLRTGRVVAELKAHPFYTDAVAFAPDGSLFATGSMDGTAKLWRTGSWELIATLKGHLLGIHSIAFSPDSRRLATGSLGREAVKLWDVTTCQEVLNLPLPKDMIFWLNFSPEGRTLAAFGTTSGLVCWSVPLPQETGAQGSSVE